MERFRIHKEEYVNKTFRMPRRLINELNQTAHQQGISTNELVMQCCRYSLENLETDEADSPEQEKGHPETKSPDNSHDRAAENHL